jgi:hypothetical protein
VSSRRFAGGWQIRIEDGHETVKSYVSRTSQEALAIADSG